VLLRQIPTKLRATWLKLNWSIYKIKTTSRLHLITLKFQCRQVGTINTSATQIQDGLQEIEVIVFQGSEAKYSLTGQKVTGNADEAFSIHRQQRGFTLVELLVAVAITGFIVAALSLSISQIFSVGSLILTVWRLLNR